MTDERVPDEGALREELGALAKEYTILKGICFISWSANVIFMIFGVIFMNQLGVSLSGIFLLNVLVIIVSFLASTVVNRLSDKARKRKLFLVLSYALRTTSIFFLALGNDLFMFILYYIITSILNPLSFDVAIVYEMGEKIEFLRGNIDKTVSKKDIETRYYLKYRMFGSLGWAITAPVAGLAILLLNESVSPSGLFLPNLPGYRIFLYIAFAIYAFTTITFEVTYNEKRYAKIHIPEIHDQRGAAARPKDRGKLTNPAPHIPGAFILLLVTVVLFQSGASLFQTPYGIFMRDFSQGNLFFVGTSYFFSAIFEAPLFIIAYKIIKSKGYETCLSISFILEILRVAITVAVIPLGLPLLVLPLQSMNSFSFRWPSLAHGNAVVSPMNKASGMNFVLVFEKVGSFLGSILGSFIAAPATNIETYTLLFTSSLGFLIACAIVFMTGTPVLKERRKHQLAEYVET
nr:MFS transporter [Candidatus Sigynarchaeota archaeon]